MWKEFNINEEVCILKESTLSSSKDSKFITGKVSKKGTKYLTVLIDGKEVKFNSRFILINGFISYSYRLFKSKDEYYELIDLQLRKKKLIESLDTCSKSELKDILNFVDMYFNTKE